MPDATNLYALVSRTTKRQREILARATMTPEEVRKQLEKEAREQQIAALTNRKADVRNTLRIALEATVLVVVLMVLILLVWYLPFGLIGQTTITAMILVVGALYALLRWHPEAD